MIHRNLYSAVRIAVLFVVLAQLLSPFWLHAGEDTYTYGASPWMQKVDSGDLVIKFGIRRNGDAVTVAAFRFPASSKWRPFFDEQVKKEDFLYSYFEIKTNQEILPPRPTVLARLGIVTKDVMKDLAENSRMNPDDGIGRPLSDSMIVSVRMITQNEFLGVNPRIVPVPPAAHNTQPLSPAPMNDEGQQPPFWVSLLPLLFITILLAGVAFWLAPRKGRSPFLALAVVIPCGGPIVIIYLLSLTDKKILDEIAELKRRIGGE